MAPRSSDFTSKRLTEEILAMAQGMERRMQREFIKSVTQIADDPELVKLLRDIQSGKFIALTPEVENRIARINLGEADIVKVAQQAMAQSGRVTTRATGLNMRFDITNPRAVQAARTLGAELVTNVNATTRQTLRDIISDMTDGSLTFQQAKRAIANEVGLLPQHRQAVIRYRQNLAASGKAYKQIVKESDRYAKRLLNYRAEVIARTEVAKATSLGQLETWQQALDNDLIPPDALRVWITAQDERLCPICAPMEGETATIDGVWETLNGPISYPTAIHPQCRCTSGLVFPSPVRKVDPNGYEYWLMTRVQKHTPGGVEITKSNPWRITKADRPEILKGDYPGHPFRGNQWVQFPGATPVSTGRLRVDESADAAFSIKLEAADVEHSNMLKVIRDELHGGKTHYLMDESGSFYDEIDWDSDVDPVEQMANAFEEFTGVVIDRVGPMAFEELDVEAVAEVFDAVASLQAEWGIAPAVVSFRRTDALASVHNSSSDTVLRDYRGATRDVGGTADRSYHGTLNFNPRKMTPEGAESMRQYFYQDQMGYKQRGLSGHVPVEVTPHQAVAIHEFGHIVHNWAYGMNPGGLWNVCTTIVETSAAVSNQRSTGGRSSTLDDSWKLLEAGEAATQSAIARGGTGLPVSILPRALPTGTTGRFSPFGTRVETRGNIYLSGGSFVSQYSNHNGLEFFAETFTLVYGNPSGSGVGLRTTGTRDLGGGQFGVQSAMTSLRSSVLASLTEEFG